MRRIFPPETYGRYTDLLGRPLGEALVEPHRSYLAPVQAMRRVAAVKGLAHLTGGGFIENIPRVLPDGVAVTIDRGAWAVPPLFSLIDNEGDVSHDEMYRVFNMGMGMIVAVAPAEADAALAAAGEGAAVTGRAVAREGDARVMLQ